MAFTVTASEVKNWLRSSGGYQKLIDWVLDESESVQNSFQSQIYVRSDEEKRDRFRRMVQEAKELGLPERHPLIVEAEKEIGKLPEEEEFTVR